jgi:hypothetical protein
MGMEKENYDLVEEPWIPVLMNNGDFRRMGILEVLAEAHEIRGVAASNPMDRFAVLRLLLALLYWCKGNPPDHPAEEIGDPFPAGYFSKITGNKEAFNLLGEGPRFYQYGYNGKGTPTTPNYLIHEIPTGTYIAHFVHARDGVDGLCPACCAMGLTRLPVFATEQGSGKGPGINRKPPVYVVPLGPSLAATLRLCWQPHPNLGTPAWEDADIQLLESGKVPLLTGLTWLPRVVWLDLPTEPEAGCISCGRVTRLIRQSIFVRRVSVKLRRWDPFVVYLEDEKDVRPLRSVNPISSMTFPRSATREWTKVLLGAIQRYSPLLELGESRIWVISFSTDRAKYFEAIDYEFGFPQTSSNLTEIADLCDKWYQWRPRAKRTPWAAFSGVIPHVEEQVSARAGELLGSEEAWLRAAEEYRPLMATVARALSPGVTTEALERRRRIAAQTPAVVFQKETEIKARRKKGVTK